MKKAKENFENLLNKIEKEYNELNTKCGNESESLTKEKESVTEKLNDLTFIIKFSSLNNYDTNWPKYKNFSC
jgi:hypothetical protein